MTLNLIHTILATFALFSSCNCISMESRLEKLEFAMQQKDEQIVQLESALLKKDKRMDQMENALVQTENVLVKKDNDLLRLQKQMTHMQESLSIMELKLTECSLDKSQEKTKMNMKDKPLSELIQDFNNSVHISNENEDTDLMDGKNNERQELKRQLNKTKRAVASVTPNIAFHAYQSAYRTYYTHETMVFNTEEIDIGDGYDNNDGIYVVPVTGVYVFTWKLISDINTYHVADLMIDGILKDSAIADSQHGIIEGNGLIVVHVNKGDHVSVRIGEYNGGGPIISVPNYGRTKFSGWLLFSQ